MSERSAWHTTEDNAVENEFVSADSILEQLPTLAEGIRDVLIQSDTELLTRFAELFSEIGQTIGQAKLSDKAMEILTCTHTLPESSQQLTMLVDQLCQLCDELHAAASSSNSLQRP